MDSLRALLFGSDGTRLDSLLGGLGFLLAGPGRLLVMIFDASESDEIYVTRMRDLALPLGIGLWLFAALVARVAWAAHRQPREARMQVDRVTRVAVDAYRRIVGGIAGQLRALAEGWTSRDVWGAAWRAEVVHLALYLVVPLLLEVLRVVAFVMFLPFSLLGGYKGEGWAGSVRHLNNPVCVTFVSNCRSPSHTFRSPTDAEVAQCQAGPCPPDSIWLVDPYWWVWKGAWALIAFAWIRRWRARQRGVPPPVK